ncbi:MAG: PQQ-dependent sugar dehydrogenase [Halomonas sp.]|jgi:glucose/arabinose dehydrogenase|uniref:PQQ-dependent sugar dehydrogenase n=1 Tax=Billgrantia tianxiuensis TaxID=2497861 RepID=A0A6I6SIT4_9GAMM|nr:MULTISPECIES: PQQ-dependent sugar dehydrogenase [Halomonas]MCE8032879.1 PQQ-dependent sugar dehydrogenase [Halomonas sp. MCCC 1A11057]MDX5431946.1 PQQ-dependent sugar dehydrogenase [Halomonas sp.]QHC49241.1 PQQ-dependent sugar dehydrogenase [Halomonas tianxiuensis]
MHEASKRLAVPLLAGIVGSTGSAQAVEVVAERIATEHFDLRLERIAEGLEHPWSVAMLPDGRFLVSERPGRLALVEEDGSVTHLDGLPEIRARIQGGLLDVVLHPQYGDGEHDWIYFTWSKPEGNGQTATALGRARLDDARLSDVETLFVQGQPADPGRHYGSRLAWLPDGTLLMSIGERGTPARAQDSRDHAGSILRLTETGDVPDDNPFVDDEDTLDEIFTLGNRNAQGLIVTQQGEAWATEHGPLGGDELNLLVGGENYGWPEVSLGLGYGSRNPIGEDSLPGMRDPVHVFEERFAPSGLAQVTAETFDAWQGNLLAGGLHSEQLHRLVLEGDQVSDWEMVLDGQIGRIRDVRQGHDGAIYLLNDDPQGSLYRLRPVD